MYTFLLSLQLVCAVPVSSPKSPLPADNADAFDLDAKKITEYVMFLADITRGTHAKVKKLAEKIEKAQEGIDAMNQRYEEKNYAYLAERVDEASTTAADIRDAFIEQELEKRIDKLEERIKRIKETIYDDLITETPGETMETLD
tara:strand:- start:431 stop:862 length:432 start_codon:yes stop_codon:yes gene_type:complete